MTAPHRPTAENPYPPEAKEGNPDPFEHAVCLPLAKEVHLGQLADEIGASVGEEVHLAVAGPEDDQVLWVSPGSVDEAKVSAVLKAHAPEEHYGVPEEEKLFAKVLAKAISDEKQNLSDEELHAAVLGLMRRVNGSVARGMQAPTP